jgi:hypothetical protein
MSAHGFVVLIFIVINFVILFFALKNKFAFSKKVKDHANLVIARLGPIGYEERGTVNKLESLNSAFKGSSLLKPYWDAYSTSIVSTDPIQPEPLFLSYDSSEIFNIENLMNESDSYVSFSIWNAVPQVLTSVGIIGTFSSILISLNGMTTSNIDENFIKVLVDSLASGFLSSLVGISFAVGFIVLEKMRTKDITSSLARINRWISSAFPKMTVENILIKQSHTLSNLSVDIQTSISNGFSQMTGGLGEALADVMDDETKKTIKEGVAASFVEMNKILTEIRNESKELHHELDALKVAKNEMFNNIKTLTEDQKKIQSEINIQNENLVENLKAFEKTMAPLNEVAKQVQGTNELSDKLIQSVKNISDISTQMGLSVSRSEELSSNAIQKIGQLTSTITEEYKGMGSNVETWVKESNSHLENNLKEFDRSISSVLNQVVTLSNSFNTGVISLERTVSKLSERESA